MNVHRRGASAIVRAPAKLNLFFEVLAKRSDGYHEVETLMVPVALFDEVIASPKTSPGIELDCRWADEVARDGALGTLPPPAENLATKAVELLARRAGLSKDAALTPGLSLTIIKRIPAAAGLGGASSDAAAALLVANAVWNLGWSRAELAALAAELGSDVPFFFASGAAVCRGRGDVIEPIAAMGTLDYVIVRPPEGLATGSVYARSEVPRAARSVAPLVAALARGDTRGLQGLVHNRLQPAATGLSCWIERLEREFAAEACLASQMSGSGSSYFGICRHARHAQRVARRLRARGVGQVFVARGCG